MIWRLLALSLGDATKLVTPASNNLYSATLFDYSEKMNPYFAQGLELGRALYSLVIGASVRWIICGMGLGRLCANILNIDICLGLLAYRMRTLKKPSKR